METGVFEEKELKTIDDVEREGGVIVLRFAYGKQNKEYQKTMVYPTRNKNGQYKNPEYVRRVNQAGDVIYLDGDKEKNSLIWPEDRGIEIKDGTEFDLKDDYQRMLWNIVKWSPDVVSSIEEMHKQSKFKARFYAEIPEAENYNRASKAKLKAKAVGYINAEKSLKRMKSLASILNHDMEYSDDSSVYTFLVEEVALRTPKKIIDLYESPHTETRILLHDALKKGVVKKDGTSFKYDTTFLGNEEATAVVFLQDPTNTAVRKSIMENTYQELSEYKPKTRKPSESTSSSTTSKTSRSASKGKKSDGSNPLGTEENED